MNNSHRGKLFVMMVLEFFIWGAWLPLIFGYLPSLGFTTSEQSWILNAFPIAAIVGMFFSNQFADRNFAAEKFLAFSHLIGGLAMLGLAYTKAFWPFFGLMLVHCLLYVPTISITNSIAFANMKDAQKEFGIVRMGGTIGWILAAWPFTFILVDWDKVHAANPQGLVAWLGTVLSSGLTGDAMKSATVWTFIVAGIASLLLAAFSFVLPHTPPKKATEIAHANDKLLEDGCFVARLILLLTFLIAAAIGIWAKFKGISFITAICGGIGPFSLFTLFIILPVCERAKVAWLYALGLLKHPFVLVLWLVTLVDSFVHNCYFNWTGSFLGAAREAGGVGIPGNWIMPVMSVGQVAEILTMFVLGTTLRKLGWRTTMIFGILGHAARFAVYAFFPQHHELIILVQVLHGICYAFFFATVYIFVDAYFPKDARSSAQGLFNVMILGIGALLANSICPWLGQKIFTQDGVTNFHGLFLVPMISAIGAAVAMALFFHPPKTEQPATAGH